MARESSFQKGLGFGCGIVFGILLAKALIFFMCCGGLGGLTGLTGWLARPTPEPQPPRDVPAENKPQKPDPAEVARREAAVAAKAAADAAAEEERQATEKLGAAGRRLERGEASAAKRDLESILQSHPKTEAAVRAQKVLAGIGPALVAEEKRHTKEKSAASVLADIKQLIAERKTELAKFRLERFIKEHAGTKAAEEARELLKKLE